MRWLQRLAALAPAAFTAVAAAFLTAYSWAVKADGFVADPGAAALTGEPRALVSALKKTGAIAGGELVLP
ncbi:MAG: hypothetical protein HY748_03680 [Elusimicrobia bacterium]|nr:hypothetical protein [Elusimicrobiota bacterium]